MPLYDFECDDCKNIWGDIQDYRDKSKRECPKCKGRNTVRLIGMPAVVGTRDSFGIGQAFRDGETGKVIDNWKSWEKAGFRNPLETTKEHHVKEQIKGKIERIRRGTSCQPKKPKEKK